MRLLLCPLRAFNHVCGLVGQNQLMGQPLTVISWQVSWVTASADPRRTCVYYIRASCLSDALIVNIRVIYMLCTAMENHFMSVVGMVESIRPHRRRVLHFLSSQFLTDSQRKRRLALEKSWAALRNRETWISCLASARCAHLFTLTYLMGMALSPNLFLCDLIYSTYCELYLSYLLDNR